MHALTDINPEVRSAAAGSLSSFGGNGLVINALIQALLDDNAQVRVDAASSLGYVGDGNAINALRIALKDPSERVRFFAKESLTRLNHSSTT